MSLFFAVDFSRTLSGISFSLLPDTVPPHTPSCSVTVTPTDSCGCCFSLARTLPREYYVLTRNAMSLLVFHIPSPSWYDNRVLSLCLPSLLSPSSTPKRFPQNCSLTLCLAPPLDSIPLFSLPFDLFSRSFSRYDFSAPPIERSSNSRTTRLNSYSRSP